MLEILAKERLVGKVQLVCNFLNAQLGRLQQGFGFQNDETVNPFARRLSADFLHYGGKVLGSEEHLISIVGHTALFLIGLGNSTDKALEQVFLPAFGNAFLDDMSLIDIIYLIKRANSNPE